MVLLASGDEAVGGVEAQRDVLMTLKLPELVRRALAAGVDGALLGDAMRLRPAPPTGGLLAPAGIQCRVLRAPKNGLTCSGSFASSA